MIWIFLDAVKGLETSLLEIKNQRKHFILIDRQTHFLYFIFFVEMDQSNNELNSYYIKILDDFNRLETKQRGLYFKLFDTFTLHRAILIEI